MVIAALMFTAFTVTALAIDNWYTTDQQTLKWAAVTLEDGSPIPEGESVKYYLYQKNEDGSGVTFIATTAALEYTFTVDQGAKIIPGVSSARVLADGTEVDQSEIGWSDDPTATADGGTFGFRNLQRTARPGGLAKK